jgi:hypothetical protein
MEMTYFEIVIQHSPGVTEGKHPNPPLSRYQEVSRGYAIL